MRMENCVMRCSGNFNNQLDQCDRNFILTVTLMKYNEISDFEPAYANRPVLENDHVNIVHGMLCEVLANNSFS